MALGGTPGESKVQTVYCIPHSRDAEEMATSHLTNTDRRLENTSAHTFRRFHGELRVKVESVIHTVDDRFEGRRDAALLQHLPVYRVEEWLPHYLFNSVLAISCQAKQYRTSQHVDSHVTLGLT